MTRLPSLSEPPDPVSSTSGESAAQTHRSRTRAGLRANTQESFAVGINRPSQPEALGPAPSSPEGRREGRGQAQRQDRRAPLSTWRAEGGCAEGGGPEGAGPWGQGSQNCIWGVGGVTALPGGRRAWSRKPPVGRPWPGRFSPCSRVCLPGGWDTAPGVWGPGLEVFRGRRCLSNSGGKRGQ